MTDSPPRVLHVITGLGRGGAEVLLLRLLEDLGEDRARHRVVSLRPPGALTGEIQALGVPVTSLGMSSVPTPAGVLRLARVLRSARGEVIQTWLLHTNVLAGLIARLLTRSPIVWGVHVTAIDRPTHGAVALLLQRIEALCSWFVPTRIVACSISARDVMERMRYRHSRMVTILNGFDTEKFKPNPEARASVRAELDVPADAVLIVHSARFHPTKDHRTLLRAAKLVLDRAPSARFLLCGDEVTSDNPSLAPLVENLDDRIRLLGHRDDLPRILEAADLAVHSSIGEALPLAIGEAMATGLPVVSTRCGDIEDIVGDAGEIVPVGDPEALAAALLKMIALDPEERRLLGDRARQRIRESYSMVGMVERYRETWREALSGPAQAPS